MADPTQIITTAQYKAYAGITDSNSDTILGKFCDGVTSFINQYCNRNFLHQTYDVYLNGNDNYYLRNLQRPITEVTAITIDDTALDLTEEAADDNYYWWAEGKIYYGGGFSEGIKNVRLQYKAGYTTMPEDLIEAAYLIISAMWEKQGKTTALSEGTPSGFSKSFTELEIPQLAKEILDRYMLQIKPNLDQSFFIDVI